MNWPELIGLMAGFLTTMGMIPQVWRLFRLRTAHEISLTFTLSFVVGIALWLVYGILNRLFAVIFWNALNFLLCSAMLYAKLKWGLH